MKDVRQNVSRRQALRYTLCAGAMAAMFEPARAGAAAIPEANQLRGALKRYALKKSINLWAFPYPQRMNLRQCLQLAKDAGYEGIELNYDLENDLSPKAGPAELREIRKLADDIGIAISGLCSFLFWQFPLTSNDSVKRSRGLELADKLIEAAHGLGIGNLLVVPGAVEIPWRDDYEPVSNEVCHARAREAVCRLIPKAERLKVSLNIENIFYNGFLMTPMEMTAFVDSFQSEVVGVHFDTGNVAMFQNAEHWIPLLGRRIRNVHFKEFNKHARDSSLDAFRPLLDGTTNWPAVMEAFECAGYSGFAAFEYFHPYSCYPEALIRQTSDSLDRILGRKR